MDHAPSPVQIKDNWTVQETRFDPSQTVTGGSNFMTGNGYLGYRGTFPEWRKEQYTGCVVTDTYDNADGKWKELCTVPNALFVQLWEGTAPVALSGSPHDYVHGLYIRHGKTFGGYTWESPEGGRLRLDFERFASYRHLHLVAQKLTITADKETLLTLRAGIDSEVWSLNGEHFSECTPFLDGTVRGTDCKTTEKGLALTVAGSFAVRGTQPENTKEEPSGTSSFMLLDFSLAPGETLVFEQMMGVYSQNDVTNPKEEAVKLVSAAVEEGYDSLSETHGTIWESMWGTYSMKIDSTDDAQALLNYNFYHNIIATPAHTDHLPIGARGLSCQAYQGAAFWDQEIFNLPMFLYTDPGVARNLLVYRYKTLDGARRKAERLGYRGAFYAWISGDTGDELCPDYFFVDVLTGRKIRNHFNDWQIHISPDIAYAVWHYYIATGDWDFICEYGAEMLFEIARFLVSYSYFKMDKKRYEIVRVLGPDEYHENADNNTFTNVQAAYALAAAEKVYRRLEEEEPDYLDRIGKKIALHPGEVKLWKDMCDRMYIPEPEGESGLIEQFDGYFELEDITPDRLKERLKDPGEYWGWPNGIAFETQVIKQADLVQLFCLHPDLYSRDTIRTNYDYYEARTQHRSSLSPAVHSIVAAKIDRLAQACFYFHTSCTIDLYNTNPPVSGGTFIGGIHTAACGIAWQMVVFGFAGFRTEADHIRFEPNLPPEWNKIEFSIIYRNQELRVRIDHKKLSVESGSENSEEIEVRTEDSKLLLAPGSTIELSS
ncbi:MAG: glycosyl hydrolase family 65 protein [Spirochaetaceae bacterium]